ncbi:MAG: hypothetical protein ABFD04_09270 [Syntrophomonas sp.]
MLAIFGSEAAAAEVAGPLGLLNNPVVQLLIVALAIFIFIKYCGWAKGFTLSSGFKKIIFILTGVGLVGFNIFYSMGNSAIAEKGWSMATYACVASLVWVFIFAFALMAETKAE